MRMADFDDGDEWPRRWAEQYVARARDEVGGWLKSHGVRFFPVVNWAERGVHGDGNSVPRFHLTWGCGKALVDEVWGSIQSHPRRSALEVRFRDAGGRARLDGPGRATVSRTTARWDRVGPGGRDRRRRRGRQPRPRAQELAVRIWARRRRTS